MARMFVEQPSAATKSRFHHEGTKGLKKEQEGSGCLSPERAAYRSPEQPSAATKRRIYHEGTKGLKKKQEGSGPLSPERAAYRSPG